MSRDNDSWVAELKSEQEPALTDLRDALLRNLRRSLSHRNRVDEAFLEDAVQESIIRILQRIDQFEDRSRFLTWATSIAIRVALSELRRRRWKDVSLDEIVSEAGFSPLPISGSDTDPEARLEKQTLVAALQRSIAEDLTERQRTALLAELKGMPQDEIARQLGSNRNAIYKLTHDARKKLRAGMEAAGYSAEDIATTAVS